MGLEAFRSMSFLLKTNENALLSHFIFAEIFNKPAHTHFGLHPHSNLSCFD
tara:strand:+ start:7707 stop:7859 length:153 start_codon:yes stop_codon:yes gene_type:complete